MGAFQKILVTTDFSECADLGLAEAERIAAECDAEVVVLHVLHSDIPLGVSARTEEEIEHGRREHAATSLEERIQSRSSSVRFRPKVAVGNVAEKINVVAGDESVDLIVICSHGRSALGRVLLGSTAEAVLHGAAVPVLVVPRRKG
ncbi:MAG: universal stress protein [Acidobacteriota bacterium]